MSDNVFSDRSWMTQPTNINQNTLPAAGGYTNWAAAPAGVPPPSAFGTPAAPPPTYNQSTKPVGFTTPVADPVVTRAAQPACTFNRPVTTVPVRSTNSNQNACWANVRTRRAFYWVFCCLLVFFCYLPGGR